MKIKITLEIDILDENVDDLTGCIDDDVVPSLSEALQSALDDNQYAYEPDSLATEVGYAFK